MESLSCRYPRLRLLGWVHMSRSARKRVLLLGATGLLGSHLAVVLPTRFETYSPKPRMPMDNYEPAGIHWLSTFFDATHFEALNGLLEEVNPDFIVNCVAITPTSPVANNEIANITVNGLFPHQLVSMLRNRNTRLIHISTDGVFSGRKGNYAESDTPDPPDLYGRSKLLGEITWANCLTIRTSFFGLSPRRSGLVDWLLQQQGRTIKGYTRSVFSGLYVMTLARLIANVIGQETFLTGLYHVGTYAISKYDLLVALARTLEVDVTIEPVDVPVLDRSLDSSRFRALTGFMPPSWDEMITELVNDKANYDTWWKQR